MAWTQDFLDTFSTYQVANILSEGHWTSGLNGGAVTIAEDGLQGLGGGGTMSRTIGSTTAGRIVAARWSGHLNTGESCVFAIRDNSAVVQLALTYLESTGDLKLYFPNGSSLVTSGLNLPNDALRNTVLAVYFDGANLHFEVRNDTIQVAALTSSDKGGTASLYATALTPQLGIITLNKDNTIQGVNRLAWVYGKVYSGSGGIWGSTDLPGNVSRGVQRATADGFFDATKPNAHWQPNTGTNYAGTVNEQLCDENVTYIKTTSDPNNSPTSLDRATWVLGATPTNLASVEAVQRRTVLTSAAGAASMKLMYRTAGDSNSANNTFGSAFTPASSYQVVLTQLPTDPRDASAWTKGKLDSLEMGVECEDLA